MGYYELFMMIHNVVDLLFSGCLIAVTLAVLGFKYWFCRSHRHVKYQGFSFLVKRFFSDSPEKQYNKIIRIKRQFFAVFSPSNIKSLQEILLQEYMILDTIYRSHSNYHILSNYNNIYFQNCLIKRKSIFHLLLKIFFQYSRKSRQCT